MPPKNKASKNAFYYYMVELKEKNPGKFTNMEEAAAAAGERWKTMNAYERKPYENLAKASKGTQKVIKYTSNGKNIELVQKEQLELMMNEQSMKDNIAGTINLSAEMGNLPNEPFYVVHANYFCYCNANKRYYPAEIAIVKFNLRHGYLDENVLTMICKPGPLPLGYLSLAKQISEDFHQIPPPMSSETEYNLEEVANDLWKFIKKTSCVDKKLPPVYASKKNLPVVENILNNFSADFDYEDLKVYSLEYLFFYLRNSCSEEKVWVASSMSELELEKDKYEFCPDIPCEYHIKSDVPNHCSQSHVIRSIYTICDHCCADVGIDLVPGQHVPRKAKLNPTRSNSRATSSIASSSARNSVSRYGYKDDNGYLSRAESDYVSETSTVVDVTDFGAVSGFDSELSNADTDEWFPPLPKSKGLNSSQSSGKQPLRRPKTLSAALTGPTGIGKGRGKGIGAHFPGNQ